MRSSHNTNQVSNGPPPPPNFSQFAYGLSQPPPAPPPPMQTGNFLQQQPLYPQQLTQPPQPYSQSNHGFQQRSSHQLTQPPQPPQPFPSAPTRSLPPITSTQPSHPGSQQQQSVLMNHRAPTQQLHGNTGPNPPTQTTSNQLNGLPTTTPRPTPIHPNTSISGQQQVSYYHPPQQQYQPQQQPQYQPNQAKSDNYPSTTAQHSQFQLQQFQPQQFQPQQVKPQQSQLQQFQPQQFQPQQFQPQHVQPQQVQPQQQTPHHSNYPLTTPNSVTLHPPTTITSNHHSSYPTPKHNHLLPPPIQNIYQNNQPNQPNLSNNQYKPSLNQGQLSTTVPYQPHNPYSSLPTQTQPQQQLPRQQLQQPPTQPQQLQQQQQQQQTTRQQHKAHQINLGPPLPSGPLTQSSQASHQLQQPQKPHRRLQPITKQPQPLRTNQPIIQIHQLHAPPPPQLVPPPAPAFSSTLAQVYQSKTSQNISLFVDDGSKLMNNSRHDGPQQPPKVAKLHSYTNNNQGTSSSTMTKIHLPKLESFEMNNSGFKEKFGNLNTLMGLDLGMMSMNIDSKNGINTGSLTNKKQPDIQTLRRLQEFAESHPAEFGTLKKLQEIALVGKNHEERIKKMEIFAQTHSNEIQRLQTFATMYPEDFKKVIDGNSILASTLGHVIETDFSQDGSRSEPTTAMTDTAPPSPNFTSMTLGQQAQQQQPLHLQSQPHHIQPSQIDNFKINNPPNQKQKPIEEDVDKAYISETIGPNQPMVIDDRGKPVDDQQLVQLEQPSVQDIMVISESMAEARRWNYSNHVLKVEQWERQQERGREDEDDESQLDQLGSLYSQFPKFNSDQNDLSGDGVGGGGGVNDSPLGGTDALGLKRDTLAELQAIFFQFFHPHHHSQHRYQLFGHLRNHNGAQFPLTSFEYNMTGAHLVDFTDIDSLIHFLEANVSHLPPYIQTHCHAVIHHHQIETLDLETSLFLFQAMAINPETTNLLQPAEAVKANQPACPVEIDDDTDSGDQRTGLKQQQQQQSINLATNLPMKKTKTADVGTALNCNNKAIARDDPNLDTKLANSFLSIHSSLLDEGRVNGLYNHFLIISHPRLSKFPHNTSGTVYYNIFQNNDRYDMVAVPDLLTTSHPALLGGLIIDDIRAYRKYKSLIAQLSAGGKKTTQQFRPQRTTSNMISGDSDDSTTPMDDTPPLLPGQLLLPQSHPTGSNTDLYPSMLDSFQMTFTGAMALMLHRTMYKGKKQSCRLPLTTRTSEMNDSKEHCYTLNQNQNPSVNPPAPHLPRLTQPLRHMVNPMTNPTPRTTTIPQSTSLPTATTTLVPTNIIPKTTPCLTTQSMTTYIPDPPILETVIRNQPGTTLQNSSPLSGMTTATTAPLSNITATNTNLTITMMGDTMTTDSLLAMVSVQGTPLGSSSDHIQHFYNNQHNNKDSASLNMTGPPPPILRFPSLLSGATLDPPQPPHSSTEYLNCTEKNHFDNSNMGPNTFNTQHFTPIPDTIDNTKRNMNDIQNQRNNSSSSTHQGGIVATTTMIDQQSQYNNNATKIARSIHNGSDTGGYQQYNQYQQQNNGQNRQNFDQSESVSVQSHLHTHHHHNHHNHHHHHHIIHPNHSKIPGHHPRHQDNIAPPTNTIPTLQISPLVPIPSNGLNISPTGSPLSPSSDEIDDPMAVPLLYYLGTQTNDQQQQQQPQHPSNSTTQVQSVSQLVGMIVNGPDQQATNSNNHPHQRQQSRQQHQYQHLQRSRQQSTMLLNSTSDIYRAIDLLNLSALDSLEHGSKRNKKRR